MVDPPEAMLFSAMVVFRAFALEKLLKSLLTREGHDIEKEPKLRKHDLQLLYDALDEETKKRCQREYYTCASVAADLQRKTGFDEKIELTLRNLLARHKDDFEEFRYAEGKDEVWAKDGLNMFIAMVTLDMLLWEEDEEGDGDGGYTLWDRSGRERKVHEATFKSLLRRYMANGGQDLAQYQANTGKKG